MLRKCIFIGLLVCLFLSASQVANTQKSNKYDLVITNARIIDGTGNPWFHGSIAIKGGKIADIGKIDTQYANSVLDAKNNIVAPGFIDVHSHAENVFANPKAENFIRMGVTSIVMSTSDSPAF